VVGLRAGGGAAVDEADQLVAPALVKVEQWQWDRPGWAESGSGFIPGIFQVGVPRIEPGRVGRGVEVAGDQDRAVGDIGDNVCKLFESRLS